MTFAKDVEETPENIREQLTTEKWWPSHNSGDHSRETDEPYGANEGSTTVETESFDCNVIPISFLPAGKEAIGDF